MFEALVVDSPLSAPGAALARVTRQFPLHISNGISVGPPPARWTARPG